MQHWLLGTSTSDSVRRQSSRLPGGTKPHPCRLTGATRASHRDHNQKRLGLNQVVPSPARPGGSDSCFNQERARPLSRSQLSDSDRRETAQAPSLHSLAPRHVQPTRCPPESSDPLGDRLATIQAHAICVDESDCCGVVKKPTISSAGITPLPIGYVSWYSQPSTREAL